MGMTYTPPAYTDADALAAAEAGLLATLADGEALIRSGAALDGAIKVDASGAAAALTVASDAATVDFSDAVRYRAATITASVELTLSSPVVGEYRRIALTNSGGSVTAPTFAAGPSVKQSGSGTFSTSDGAINELRFECVDASGSGSYVYTISQRAA